MKTTNHQSTNEQEALSIIKELRSRGVTYAEIAKELSDRGITKSS